MSYESIDGLVNEFERKSKPSQWRGLLRAARNATATLLVAGAIATGFGLGAWRQLEETHQEQVAEARIPEIKPQWSTASSEIVGDSIEIGNNLYEAAVEVSNHTKTRPLRGRYPSYPDVHALTADPGDEIYVQIKARSLFETGPTEWSPHFPGKVYIEGFDAEEFKIQPAPYDNAAILEAYDSIGYASAGFTIPKDLPAGVHILATEIYALTPEEHEKYMGKKNYSGKIDLKMPKEGIAMIRKRVPILVGDVDRPVDIRSVYIGAIPSRAVFHDPTNNNSGMVAKYGTYTVRVPEEDHYLETEEGKGTPYIGLGLPWDNNEERQSIMILGSKWPGRDWPLLSTYIPIERLCTNCRDLEEIKSNLLRDHVVNAGGPEAAHMYTDEMLEEEAREVRREEGYYKWGIPPVTREFSDQVKQLRIQEFGYLPSEMGGLDDEL